MMLLLSLEENTFHRERGPQGNSEVLEVVASGASRQEAIALNVVG